MADVDYVLYTCRSLGEALTGGSNGLSFLKVVIEVNYQKLRFRGPGMANVEGGTEPSFQDSRGCFWSWYLEVQTQITVGSEGWICRDEGRSPKRCRFGNPLQRREIL